MKTLGTLLFPGFELLDVAGPLEMFGPPNDLVEIRMVAETAGPIASTQGVRFAVDDLTTDDHAYDMILVPGGMGTRREVDNAALLDWLRRVSATAELVMSVCTGSALLARAGLLDGKRATTNKRAFSWVTSQADKVLWQPKARWAEDGKFLTSSGISAGMDMSLAAIARLAGREEADVTALRAEYDWHDDPDWDPFAEHYGLV